jgi:hypothetical protein
VFESSRRPTRKQTSHPAAPKLKSGWWVVGDDGAGTCFRLTVALAGFEFQALGLHISPTPTQSSRHCYGLCISLDEVRCHITYLGTYCTSLYLCVRASPGACDAAMRTCGGRIAHPNRTTAISRRSQIKLRRFVGWVFNASCVPPWPPPSRSHLASEARHYCRHLFAGNSSGVWILPLFLLPYPSRPALTMIVF